MRPSWHEYFLDLAIKAATRSTCTRAHHGPVIVRDKNVISTGYNGSAPGAPHCDDVGCEVENFHCQRCLHAEMNAIIQAAKNGVRTKDADMYVTALPCYNCIKAIANAGIYTVYYAGYYTDDPRVYQVAREAGVRMVDLSQPPFNLKSYQERLNEAEMQEETTDEPQDTPDYDELCRKMKEFAENFFGIMPNVRVEVEHD
jgi:dCMP deaminase